jgi:NAD(P)H-dependent flavin oxidoreductase YrpB (nitropropane dioxygenase family)
MSQGELEIGQISSRIREIKAAGDIIREIVDEYQQLLSPTSLKTLEF